MNLYALIRQGFVQELSKVGSLDPEAFEKSVRRLEKLENEPPDTEQLKRYALVGATVTPLASLLEKVISGDDILVRDQARKVLPGRSVRYQAAKMVGGAVGGGVLPVIRHHYDRMAERKKLKSELEELEEELKKQPRPLDEPSLQQILDPSKVAFLTPRERLSRSQRVGKHRLSSVGQIADPKGPSIAQIAKPKGYGQPIPGASKLDSGDEQPPSATRPPSVRHR